MFNCKWWWIKWVVGIWPEFFPNFCIFLPILKTRLNLINWFCFKRSRFLLMNLVMNCQSFNLFFKMESFKGFFLKSVCCIELDMLIAKETILYVAPEETHLRNTNISTFKDQACCFVSNLSEIRHTCKIWIQILVNSSYYPVPSQFIRITK